MKVCPKCNERYEDANLNFCLSDGELLMEMENVDAPPTIMMDSPRTTSEGNFGSDFEPQFSQPNQQNQQNPQDQQMYQPPFASPVGSPTNMYASKDQTLPIIALVAGLISLIPCCGIGLVAGPVALITGFLGINNVNKDPDAYDGKALAIAGMVAGGIGLLIFVGLMIIQIFAALVS